MSKARNGVGALMNKQMQFMSDLQQKRRQDEYCREARLAELQEHQEELAGHRARDEEDEIQTAQARLWSTADFDSLRVLGKGAFGVVHLVRRHGTGEFYALKKMDKRYYQKKNQQLRAYNEKNALAATKGRWCVELLCTFQDSASIYIVMEFVQGGDLFSHIERKGRFSIYETIFYMAELLEAIDTLHKCGFIHRDLKPDNMVLTARGHLKLLDFGLCTLSSQADLDLARSILNTNNNTNNNNTNNNNNNNTNNNNTNNSSSPLGRKQLLSICGTPPYMAPEAFEGSCRPESDIWSLGVIMYECLTGSLPFYSKETLDKAATNEVRQQVLGHADVLPARFRRLHEKQLAMGASRRACDEAEIFMSKILCDRSRRLTAAHIRTQQFFLPINFARITEMVPPIRIELSGPSDSSHFEQFPHEPLPVAENLDMCDPGFQWTHYEVDGRACAGNHGHDNNNNFNAGAH